MIVEQPVLLFCEKNYPKNPARINGYDKTFKFLKGCNILNYPACKFSKTRVFQA